MFLSRQFKAEAIKASGVKASRCCAPFTCYAATQLWVQCWECHTISTLPGARLGLAFPVRGFTDGTAREWTAPAM